MISESILIPKIDARLHKIASIFKKKFLGTLPASARAFGVWFGALPFTPPPFQNSWIRSWLIPVLAVVFHLRFVRCHNKRASIYYYYTEHYDVSETLCCCPF